MIAVTLASAASASAAGPHGGYSSRSAQCKTCHAVHVAKGQPILSAKGQKEICYSCHSGAGSVYDTRDDFGESVDGTSTKTSSHPVPSGALKCADCHTPHRGPAEGNPMSLSARSTEATSGLAFCGSCHSGSSGPMKVAGTPHDTRIARPGSSANVSCLGCHAEHASSNAKLERESIVRSDGTTVPVDTTTSLNPLCIACHTTPTGTFPGAPALAGAHSSSAASPTLAATQYPGADQRPGECSNCHEPHGESGNDDYARATGDSLCLSCHSAAGPYPAAYSFRGPDVWRSSAHASASGGVGYMRLGSTTPGFAAWEGTGSPTPSDPGSSLDAEATAALSVVDDSLAVTRLAQSTGSYEYQVYRFEVPEGTKVTGLQAAWNGYAEQVLGYPLTLSVWNRSLNGGAGGWEALHSGVYGSETTLTAPISPTSDYVDASGQIHLMARSRAVISAEIGSGPAAGEGSGNAFVASWGTAGPSSGWVDLGTTTAYELGSFGSTEPTMTHRVLVSTASPGVYHYRVRSVDADGRQSTSPDRVISTPAPALVAKPNDPNGELYQTFSWSMLDASRAPYTHRLTITGRATGFTYVSPWQASTTASVMLPEFDTYTWSVRSRDAAGNETAESTAGSFFIDDSAYQGALTLPSSRYAFNSDAAGAPLTDGSPDVPRSIHTNAIALNVTYELPAGSSRCATCHAVHGSQDSTGRLRSKLLANDELSTCFGGGTGGCHSSSANSASGVDIYRSFTATSSTLAHHDVMPADQAATGSSIGCASCHDPHVNSARFKFSDPDSTATTMTAGFDRFVNSSGQVFALVGAEHDGVAPVIANVAADVAGGASAPAITWATDEPATSFIDWGPTTAYENGTVGASTPLATSHSVGLSGVAAQDYHFRIRSADALGNERFSNDFMFNTDVSIGSEPTLTDQPDIPIVTVNGTAQPTLTWSPVGVSNGDPTEYFVEMRNATGTVNPITYTSGWTTSTSWTTPRLRYGAQGSWVWRVRARDPRYVNVQTAWSAEDSFSVEYSEGILYQEPISPGTELQVTAYSLSSPLLTFSPTQTTAGQSSDPAQAGTRVTSAEPTSDAAQFSVDTDLMSLEARGGSGVTTTYRAAAGWSSAAATPTPSVPGIADAAFSAAAEQDGVHWRTDLTAVDRQWNWQVARFDLGDDGATSAQEIALRWVGHGEPTTGYATSLFLWNTLTSSWEQVATRSALGSDTELIAGRTEAANNDFCLRCHDGQAPAGVAMPAGVTNLLSVWGTSTTSDFHGTRPGAGPTGSTGGLSGGYRRGDQVACFTCHDPHGSSSPYALRRYIGGVDTSADAAVNPVSAACKACHTGQSADWHSSCIACHNGFDADPEANHANPRVDFSDSGTCLDCHNHGSKTKWSPSGGIQGAPGCSRNGSHTAGCHTFKTTF